MSSVRLDHCAIGVSDWEAANRFWSSHVALTWPGPVEQAAEHLRDHGVQVEHGPAEVQAARGTARSVYFRDPDGSLVEFVCYPG